MTNAPAILASYLEWRATLIPKGGGDIRFWFSFVNCMLVYRYAYVFVWLCLDVHIVCIVLVRIGYDSCYAISSTHWAAPQHTPGPPVL